MSTLEDYEELETANSLHSDDELMNLLLTALSSESLATALSSLDDDQLSTSTAQDLWNDDDWLSTCLSATASEYSLPASETSVEMPGAVIDGVRIVDSLELLANLDKYQPSDADVVDLETSEYEMPPSETDVSMAEPQLRLLI